MSNDSRKAAKTTRQASVGRMLNLLTKKLNGQMNARLQEIGLNLNGFFIMMIMLEHEGLSQAELGKKASLPAYSMTRVLDELEGKGFLERRADPNSRRNYQIFLTPAGQSMGPKLFTIVRETNERLIAPLDGDEKQAFIDSLAKLI